jgi:hypothetical protein
MAPSVGKEGSDPCRPEAVDGKLRRDPALLQSLVHHSEHVVSGHPVHRLNRPPGVKGREEKQRRSKTTGRNSGVQLLYQPWMRRYVVPRAVFLTYTY